MLVEVYNGYHDDCFVLIEEIPICGGHKFIYIYILLFRKHCKEVNLCCLIQTSFLRFLLIRKK